MLLRVSSSQQLEADGDLSLQRQLVMDYVSEHEDWELDEKEYFEGSRSGYKTAVSRRHVLQEALEDARKREYDILAAYKDDRIGRRMWEIGAYVMALKSCQVEIHTVKDGCISPENDDIMGQMMLALRYGNAQKSSADTGMRVRDTARKLVRQGRFMGGNAPYGYELVLSGEISKHGRALHTLRILPEQAEVVRHIYNLSLYQEYGSGKIAKLLNQEERYRAVAPGGVWKSGTVAGILTNPVYAGYMAYGRREHAGGKCRRRDSSSWIRAEVSDGDIRIIDGDLWERTQEKRRRRAGKFRKAQGETGVVGRNEGVLPLIDVSFCGCCGSKLTNGTIYSYATRQKTAEKRACRIPAYRCQGEKAGIPHRETARFQARWLEEIVFEYMEGYLGHCLGEESLSAAAQRCREREEQSRKVRLWRLRRDLARTERALEAMEGQIPEAVTGNCPLTLEELAAAIRRQRERQGELEAMIREREAEHGRTALLLEAWREGKREIPTWQQVFRDGDPGTKRVVVDLLVERIDVSGDRVALRFRTGRRGYHPQ